MPSLRRSCIAAPRASRTQFPTSPRRTPVANASDRCRFVLQSDLSFAGGCSPVPPVKAWTSKPRALPRACGTRATQRSQSPAQGSSDDATGSGGASRAEAVGSAHVGQDALSTVSVRSGSSARCTSDRPRALHEAHVWPTGRFPADMTRARRWKRGAGGPKPDGSGLPPRAKAHVGDESASRHARVRENGSERIGWTRDHVVSARESRQPPYRAERLHRRWGLPPGRRRRSCQRRDAMGAQSDAWKMSPRPRRSMPHAMHLWLCRSQRQRPRRCGGLTYAGVSIRQR
jgi:hypothetical protein